MAKKRNKTALAVLKEKIINNSITDEKEIETLFYSCIENPDPVEAVRQHMRMKFNRFVSSIRNKDGLRVAFPVKNKDGTKCIHTIPGSRDIEAVAIVDKRLSRQTRGTNKTRRPVAMWKAELAGQLTLAFEQAQ